MILDVAEITVKLGGEQAIEQGVEKAAPCFSGPRVATAFPASGRRDDITLSPRDEVGDGGNHMVDFRNSDDFQEWRKLVGSFFNGAPRVTHSNYVASYD